MKPDAVVEGFDVIEDGGASCGGGRKTGSRLNVVHWIKQEIGEEIGVASSLSTDGKKIRANAPQCTHRKFDYDNLKRSCLDQPTGRKGNSASGFNGLQVLCAN